MADRKRAVPENKDISNTNLIQKPSKIAYYTPSYDDLLTSIGFKYPENRKSNFASCCNNFYLVRFCCFKYY